ncbi:MAG: hypothetical protein ACYCWW_16490 [Deltaproteobacteria bacterium]
MRYTGKRPGCANDWCHFQVTKNKYMANYGPLGEFNAVLGARRTSARTGPSTASRARALLGDDAL